MHLLKGLCLLVLSQKSQGPCASLGPDGEEPAVSPSEVEGPVDRVPTGPSPVAGLPPGLNREGPAGLPPAAPPVAELPLGPVGEDLAASPSLVGGLDGRGPTEPPPVTGTPLGPVDEGTAKLPPGGPVVGVGVLEPGGATIGGRFTYLDLVLVQGVPVTWGSIVASSRQIEWKRVCAQIDKVPQM